MLRAAGRATPPSAAADDLLDAVARRLDEALVVVDAQRRLRYANPAARALMERSGSAAAATLDEALPDYRLALLVRACLGGEAEVTRELDDLAGERHLVATGLRLPGGDGAVVVLRDESRLRRLEAVRRDFVANVSHELRTPIAAIQLLVETLQEGALQDRSVAAEFVGRIGLEAAHMAQMVSELLELSAIESGQRTLERGEVSAAMLVEAAERLRPLAEERRVSLRAEVDPATPAVPGDAAALGQVVRNLVHNAIKFTPAGGGIRLVARPGDGAKGVELRVVDTGCGIPAEQRGRIFERFYKADRSRQRDGEGTGLGLAIARHTVEAHGGSISVVSEVGEGSTFIVALPAAPSPSGAG